MSDRNPYGIDVSTANVARIYDYMLGGKDNFAADRAAAGQILKAFPESREGVQLNREFLGNAVRHLAAEEGIRQFVDIGAGLPTQKNVHQVAHETDPAARTVYVDNDPVVCVHGRALLAGAPTVAMVEGDLRAPEDVWAKAAETGLIDREEPVAVLMVAILHFLDDPYTEVAKVREMLAPGSFLVITHLSMAERRAKDTDTVKGVYSRANSGVVPRTVDEIKHFFGDFELLDNTTFISPGALERMAILGWGGVGRKR
ncbi:SAM-dependent methyltransferase [Planomonospora sp. ID67723]|uniref:SAM-dependent methyltransferase n=1 Tax=Planomonospora sp. ID67723 TaxID=2738134 RepID=UPI001A1FD26D|nr:SAM-dependent methyltransferase [Planomonospora sp. ID67723]MBG0828280.1 SAM-dependent methyltransferase [Planomonospora sp. ID67723]